MTLRTCNRRSRLRYARIDYERQTAGAVRLLRRKLRREYNRRVGEAVAAMMASIDDEIMYGTGGRLPSGGIPTLRMVT